MVKKHTISIECARNTRGFFTQFKAEQMLGDDITEYVDAEGKVLALINYPAISDNTVEITHTEVDPSLQGQGIAGLMTARAAAYLKSQGKKVVQAVPMLLAAL